MSSLHIILYEASASIRPLFQGHRCHYACIAGMLEHTRTYYIWIRNKLMTFPIFERDCLFGDSTMGLTRPQFQGRNIDKLPSHNVPCDSGRWVGASTRPVLDRSSLLRTNGFQLASTLHRRPTSSAPFLGKICKHRLQKLQKQPPVLLKTI